VKHDLIEIELAIYWDDTEQYRACIFDTSVYHVGRKG